MDEIKEDLNVVIEPQLIAEEYRGRHGSYFSRSTMVYTVAHEYPRIMGKTGLTHELEQRLVAQINAVPDARLEQLWNAAAMDFVLNEINARRKIGNMNALFSPTPEVIITFWQRCIAPLPSLEEFADYEYHVDHSDWYEKQYQWSKLREEWLERAKWPQSL